MGSSLTLFIEVGSLTLFIEVEGIEDLFTKVQQHGVKVTMPMKD